MAHPSTSPKKTPVLIIGGGPTGLSLALGLARNGIKSVLVEKEKSISDYSKAPGIHIRTREIFRQWGVEKNIIEAGNLVQNFKVFETGKQKVLFSINFREIEEEAHKPGLLILEQGKTEKILLEAVRKSGMCEVLFDTEAINLKNNADGVQINTRSSGEEQSFYAHFAVGCDGAGSFVRKELKLSFKGKTFSLKAILADIKLEDERNELTFPRLYNGEKGVTAAIKLPGGLWRIIRLHTEKPCEKVKIYRSHLAERVEEVLGAGDFELRWASSFKIHRRSSKNFRVGRSLLAGDAAHVHSPAGGQGMNSGIQDAHNLAWKMAAIFSGSNEETMLDSYETERKAVVVKNVSRYTSFITRFFIQAPRTFRSTAFYFLKNCLRLPIMRKRFLRRTSMINLRYKSSEILDQNETAAGMRLPNVWLKSNKGGDCRLYDLLPVSGAVLIEVNRKGNFSKNSYLKSIQIGPGSYSENSGLLHKILKKKDGFILVRPDLLIAWARHSKEGMSMAISRALGKA